MYRYILRLLFFLLILPCASNGTAQVADYADQGNGLHRDDVLWFTWAGTDLADGVHDGDQVIFNMPHGGTLQLDFSNVSVNYPIPDPTPGDGETPDGYRPSDMKVWCGATLYTAYNLSGSSSEALISDMSAAGVLGDGENGQDIAFDMAMTANINGVSIPVDVIAADPETTNPAGGFQEQLQYGTNAGNWGLVESVRGTNYGLSGLGTTSANISNTETGVACSGGVNSGTNSSPILLSKGQSGTTTTLHLETIFPHGDGHQGFALGALMPVDQSDAPLTYGVASHIQEMIAPFSGSASLDNVSTLFLGVERGDTDYYINTPGLLGAAGDGDDNDDVDDEDGLLRSTFTFPSTSGGSLTIDRGLVQLSNTTGSTATVHAWLDMDQSGTFETDEYASIGAFSGDVRPFGDLVFSMTNDAVAGSTLLRLRITTDNTIGSGTHDGIALNGEVEDHAVMLIDVCSDLSYPDQDNDGLNNVCDLDDDNDGIPDAVEGCAGTPDNFIGWFHNNPFADVKQDGYHLMGSFTTDYWVDAVDGADLNIVNGQGQDEQFGAGWTPFFPGSELQLNGSDANTYAQALALNEYVEFGFTTATYTGQLALLEYLLLAAGPGAGPLTDEVTVAAAISDNGFASSVLLFQDYRIPVTSTYTHYEMPVAAPFPMRSATPYDVRVYLYDIPSSQSGSVQMDDVMFGAKLCADTDLDGVANALDLDSDNDGIYDAVESGSGQAFTNGVLNGAATANGIPASVDADANDVVDYTIADSDSDGNIDSVELDSDGDLCTDVVEAGYTDQNEDGELGPIPLTVDGNGLVTSGGP